MNSKLSQCVACEVHLREAIDVLYLETL